MPDARRGPRQASATPPPPAAAAGVPRDHYAITVPDREFTESDEIAINREPSALPQRT
jgi:hypothetical protein